MTIGFLTSYAYFRKDNMRELKSRGFGAPFFADSGAFSARTLGLDLKASEYARWIMETSDVWEIYANLDVIFDSVATYKNQKYLESCGLRPLPVVHYGTPPSEVARYIEDGYDYIALGGLANRIGADPQLVKQWAIDCFDVAGDSAVFHGFGFIRKEAILALPWYTVDSSSWTSGERYGSGKLFNGDTFTGVAFRDKEAIAKNADLILEHNGNLERLLAGHYSYRDATEINAVAYLKLSEWWSKTVGEVRRPNTPNAAVGPIVYLAGTGQHQIPRGAYAMEKYKRKKAIK